MDDYGVMDRAPIADAVTRYRGGEFGTFPIVPPKRNHPLGRLAPRSIRNAMKRNDFFAAAEPSGTSLSRPVGFVVYFELIFEVLNSVNPSKPQAQMVEEAI